MSNHTPGPWEFNGGYVFDEDQLLIADIRCFGRNIEYCGVPNGKLIAAAPELFAALKRLLADRTPEALQAAQDALVKAAGKDW